MNESLRQRQLNRYYEPQLRDIFNQLKPYLPDKNKTPDNVYRAAVEQAVQKYYPQYRQISQVYIWDYKPTPSLTMVLEEILKTDQYISINITNSKVTQELFQILGSCNKIRSVELIACEVGDKYAKYLGMLNLDRLMSIAIQSDRITNRGFKQLAKLKKSKRLRLEIRNTNITTDGIKYQKYFYANLFRKTMLQHFRMNEMVHFKSICYNKFATADETYGIYLIQQFNDCLSFYLPHLSKITLVGASINIQKNKIWSSSNKEKYCLEKIQPALKMLRKVAKIKTRLTLYRWQQIQ